MNLSLKNKIEESFSSHSLDPVDIVIFGSNGDLALRKIWPALYQRTKDQQLSDSSRLWAIHRKEVSLSDFLQALEEHLKLHLPSKDWSNEHWILFKKQIFTIAVDLDQNESLLKFKNALEDNARSIRIFYLATPSSVFVDICTHLSKAQLIHNQTRVVLEKPLGKDLESFQNLNRGVLQYFKENQIYRIDHYLGKETVQNLMVLRFANNMFERIWNADSIDHVQITVAESVGLEGRIGYYDTSGALRDMVQNHLLQLLCLVAMEPPTFLDADSVRTEKLKVLLALEPLTPEKLRTSTVRGQYESGVCGNQLVPGYCEELGQESWTETFVAIRAKIDNWRWANVPFYLRTGKRLAKRCSEIVIHFKSVPHHIFSKGQSHHNNKLIIRLQPDESIKLEMTAKVPGPGGYRLKNVELNLSMADAFQERSPEAYERLLMDVVRGNATLFMRSDEVEAAWRWTDLISKGWAETQHPLSLYKAGSWGPDDSIAMISKDDRQWHKV
ncbi:MAG: glucose-6-phosphate dehydrogenase [Pseudobdellovibrionaceae bacterium]